MHALSIRAYNTHKQIGETTVEEQQMNRTTLLEKDRAAYVELENILNSLDEAQMTTAGVNGEWSIKDILVHLTAWHVHLLNLMHAVAHKQEPVLNHDENKGIDGVNADFYEEGKSRSLEEALKGFRDTHSQVIEALQQLPDEALNATPWSDSTHPLWEYFAGNTYEHYEEHMEPIRAWLAHNNEKEG